MSEVVRSLAGPGLGGVLREPAALDRIVAFVAQVTSTQPSAEV